MQEIWTQWKPINDLMKKYSVEAFSTNVNDKFKIFLYDSKNKNKKVVIHFSDGINAFRYTDESFIGETIVYIDKAYGKEFYNWSFFKVEQSEYLKWLSEKSYGISDDYKLTHYCILASDSMIDIASSYEPEVSFIE